MRILIVVDCYLPSPKSSAKHVHDLGVEFRKQGHEVTILTGTHQISRDLAFSLEAGMRIVRVRTARIKGVSKSLRAFEEIRLSGLFWRRAGSYLSQNPANLIIFYSPTIFLGSLVRKLKDLWGCPAYLILRDIFPQWAVDARILRKGLVWWYFRRKEIEQYAVADLIAVESPANLQYFAESFPGREYWLKVLYNWTALHEPGLPKTNYRTRLGLEKKVVFLYGGNIGVAQDIDNLVRLAARLAHREEIRFLLVGSGSEVERLRKSVEAKGLRNIGILPALDQNEYLAMVSEFDVGLISLDRRLKTHNVPGKLLSYLYWGIPVLASTNPGNDLFDLLERNRAGFCLVNGDDENLAMAAERLADDPGLRSEMGSNARALLEENFSVEGAVRQIFSDLRESGIVLRDAHSIPRIKAVSAAAHLNW